MGGRAWRRIRKSRNPFQARLLDFGDPLHIFPHKSRGINIHRYYSHGLVVANIVETPGSGAVFPLRLAPHLVKDKARTFRACSVLRQLKVNRNPNALLHTIILRAANFNSKRAI